MHELRLFTHDFATLKRAMRMRGFDLNALERIRDAVVKRHALTQEVQALEAQRNALSRSVAKATSAERPALIAEVSGVKIKLDKLQAEQEQLSTMLDTALLTIPNLVHRRVKQGTSESDNTIVKTHADLGRKLVTNVRPHYEIGLMHKIVDFERAVKLSGTRFWAYQGWGAELVRALISLMLDTHRKAGYTEVLPPLLVKSSALRGTGQLPKFGEDLFKIENHDHYLIPTAEVPLTGYYSNELLNLAAPIMLTAYTPCFRSEASSGGRDVRGLIRGHQFNKVELVKIVAAEAAEAEFKKMLRDARKILELLELPYREVRLCSGDLGFSALETIDLEVWIPSEQRYREISSVSQFGTFQARRLAIRYRHGDGNNYYAHTLNGSGLAIDRTIAAILENYQNPDGSIDVPKALQKYVRTKVWRLPRV